jgi:hypothetical protein
VTSVAARGGEYLLRRDGLTPRIEARLLSPSLERLVCLAGSPRKRTDARRHETRRAGETRADDLVDLDLTGLRGGEREAHRGLERVARKTVRRKATARGEVLPRIGAFRVGLSDRRKRALKRLRGSLAALRLKR